MESRVETQSAGSVCVCVCGGGGGRGHGLVQILPVWTDSGQFPLNSICLIYYAFYYDNQQKCSANVFFCHSDWINSNEWTKNATIFSWSPNIAFHLCRFSVTNWQEVAKASVKVSVALYCWYNKFNVTKTKLACEIEEWIIRIFSCPKLLLALQL